MEELQRTLQRGQLAEFYENMSNTVELNAEGYLEPSPYETVEEFNFKGIKDM